MQQQDALYVYGSSTNVDGATNLTFTVFTGVTDIHILTVGAGLSGNANLELKYKLEIAGAPTATLLTASLSATVFGTDGNVTLTERFYSDSSYTTLIPGSTLTTTGGAVSFTFGPGVTQVWIDQTATTTGDGQLTSFSNAEIEGFQSQSGGTTVPEPTSLAIWSVLAGMGVVVGWRRRQKQRCAAGTTA